MATIIKIKSSTVAGKVPDPGDLAAAELAVNLTDKKLYTKDASGEIIELSGGSSVDSGGTGERPDAPEAGDLFYDSDEEALYFWNGSSWEKIISDDGQPDSGLTLDDVVQKGSTTTGDITANSFTGDGSGLTNLPGGDVNLDEYARLDGADFTGEVTVDALFQTTRINVVDDVKGVRPAEFTTVWKNAVNVRAIQGDEQNGFHFTSNNADYSARIEVLLSDSGITLKDTSIDNDNKVIITPQGAITAKEFIGDGSGLTNLTLEGDGSGITDLQWGEIQNAPVSLGNSAPDSPVHGLIWIDTSECPPKLKIYSSIDECPDSPDGWEPIQGEGGGGGGGGGTAVDYPPAQIPGASLCLGETNITTNNQLLEFSSDGGTSWTETGHADPGEVISCRWKETAHDDTPHDESTSCEMSYQITGGASYNKTYTYKVDKLPDPVTYADGSNTAIGQYVESATTETLTGVNARTRIWAATDSTEKVQVQIDSGAWVEVPDAPDNSVLFENDQTVKIRHMTINTPEAVTTSTIYFGWDVDDSVNSNYVTTNIDAYINKPEITTPTEGGDVDQNAIELIATTFGGVETGTHSATDWQISLADDFGSIYSESLDDTSNLLSWTSPLETDDDDQTFYARVRYKSDTGLVSAWSETRSMIGRKFYFFKIDAHATGARGNGDYDGVRGGGRGVQAKGTVEVIKGYPMNAPPSNCAITTSAASGGNGIGARPNHSNGGTGGAAATVRFDGTLFLCGGGGGGGGEGSDGSTAGQIQSANASVSNGGTPNTSGSTGGSGAGTPGGAATSTAAGGGLGGGSYAPETNAIISSVWKVTSRTSTVWGSDNRSHVNVQLFRKYKSSGSWAQVGSKTDTWSGSVASLITAFYNNIKDPFSKESIEELLRTLTRGEVLDIAIDLFVDVTALQLEGRARTSIEQEIATEIVNNNLRANGREVTETADLRP